MSWQLSCADMYKFVTWLEWYDQNYMKKNFHNIQLWVHKLFVKPRATGPLFQCKSYHARYGVSMIKIDSLETVQSLSWGYDKMTSLDFNSPLHWAEHIYRTSTWTICFLKPKWSDNMKPFKSSNSPGIISSLVSLPSNTTLSSQKSNQIPVPPPHNYLKLNTAVCHIQ